MSYQGLWHRAADDGNRNCHGNVPSKIRHLHQQDLWANIR